MSKSNREDLRIERMMIYMWEDSTDPGLVKFGDHSITTVMTDAQAIAETERYIRGSLGRQKYKWQRGQIKVHFIIDASDYAKSVNRFYKHSKLDDYMRVHIGQWLGKGDFHEQDAGVAEQRIRKELNRVGQPLPPVALSRAQCQAAENVLEAVSNGSRTITAELCARFGKTIWAGTLAKELDDRQLVVVVSYVLTVFTSFENDLRSFQQFQNFKHVDMQSPTAQADVDKYLRNGDKVVAYLSMVNSPKRNQRIKYLFGKKAKRLVVIDEADFGVHQSGQAKPLIKARQSDDVVVIMTGTNADRAVSEWDVDHYLGVTYPELVINKRLGGKYTTTLKNFSHDPKRDSLVVDVEFYQMNLVDVVNKAQRNAWLDPNELPSWSKFAADPILAQGFFTRMLEAMFLGKHTHPEAHLARQTRDTSRKVSMMFLSGSMTNKNLAEAVQLAKAALPAYEVVEISGGAKVTNRKAERVVRDAIERAAKNNAHVLLLSTGMAQRSFSIPQITDLFLAYDAGGNGATIQKMSRALTPGLQGKVGRIFSLSFDPNRDDKFDSIVLETSQNHQHNRNIGSMKDAMREVLDTIDIFDCTNTGKAKIDVDDYLKQCLARKSISRVVGKIADLSLLSQDDIVALAEGNGEYFRAARVETAKKGRTHTQSPKKKASKKTDKQMEKLIAKARESIVMIVENIDIIIYGTGCRKLDDALATVQKSPEMQRVVEEEFGVSFDVIAHLFESGVINEGFVELLFDC